MIKWFKADVFLGHFEREGNRQILSNATVTLRRGDASVVGNAIVVGAGLAGLVAASELVQYRRWVFVPERPVYVSEL